MNFKQLILLGLLVGSPVFSAPVKKKKSQKAVQTQQNWWQRRSPEFKAFCVSVGTIIGAVALRYGWHAGRYWYSLRDKLPLIRKLINDEGASCMICKSDKEDDIPNAQLDWCNNCRQFICVDCKTDYIRREYWAKCPHCQSTNF